MAKVNYDGVVEAVHYGPDHQIEWVRVYRRRGSAFSDRILLSRAEFIRELKSGRRYYSGKRIPLMAGSFEVNEMVQLEQQDSREILFIGERPDSQDNLTGVPII